LTAAREEVPEVFSKLTKQARNFEKYEKSKKDKELVNCTFKPIVNKKSAYMATKTRTKFVEEVSK